MGVVTQEIEASSSIPSARLFKGLVLKGEEIILQVLPQVIKSVEILQGNGGAGTVKQFNFGEGSQYKYTKHRIESINEEKLTYVYSTIEGDALMGKVEKITNELRIEASPNGGSKFKNLALYYPAGDFVLNEDEIKAGKEMTMQLFKAVEAYLLANPNAYK